MRGRARDAASRLLRRAAARRRPVDHARPGPRVPDGHPSSSSLRKDLNANDLLMLGVGGVIGGGVFVLTGAAAHDHAGPAVVISYLVASLTSAVTGMCYTEFACEAPVAGSSYVYVSMCFGEFAGYLCGCNLGLELTISAAAVARGWTSYVATLFRARPDALRLRIGGGDGDGDGGDGDTAVRMLLLDVPAAAIVAGITWMLIRGMKDTARFNTVVTVVSLIVIGFVIVAGGAEVDSNNWTPFAPNGAEGVLAGASVVFFSFVGFDTVATCAEECANPGRDLPIGIMGSLGICAALYAAMCLVITGMSPASSIDTVRCISIKCIIVCAIRLTSFFVYRRLRSRVAFKDAGMGWAESFISFGAVAAITTALLSSLMGQPRVYMVMARDGLLPGWFARVHEIHGTPANASLFTGVTTGLLALTVDIEVLAELVSIGTLAIFGSVCAGLLVWRHARVGESQEGIEGLRAERIAATSRAACLVASCVTFSGAYYALGVDNNAGGSNPVAIVCCICGALGAIVSTASFTQLPMVNEPTKGFKCPWVPYLPAFGVAACVQLIFSLGPFAWARFFVYTAICSVFYAVRGFTGVYLGWDGFRDEDEGTEMVGVGGGGVGGGEAREPGGRGFDSRGGDEEDGVDGERETSGLLVKGASSS